MTTTSVHANIVGPSRMNFESYISLPIEFFVMQIISAAIPAFQARPEDVTIPGSKNRKTVGITIRRKRFRYPNSYITANS